MDKIIIEKAEKCSFVRQRSEVDGHDCWGNYDYTTHKYVMIDGKEEYISNKPGMYVIHDEKKALSTGYISHLDDSIRRFLDDGKMDRKLKEDRKKYFLELKKEFEKFDEQDPFGEETQK